MLPDEISSIIAIYSEFRFIGLELTVMTRISVFYCVGRANIECGYLLLKDV
jgi:hypothetical protein